MSLQKTRKRSGNREVRSILPFILLVGVGLAWHLYALLQGHANFTSDHALAGLMTQHAMDGEFHTYPMGQRHFGNVWIPFVIPFFFLMGKGSIVGLRIPFFVMTALFYVLFLVFVHRAWGRRIALITAALLAVPSYYVLFFTFYGPFNFWMPLLTACLLLVSFSSEHTKKRAFLFGGIVGLGLWVTPRFKLDAVILGSVLLLASAEWSRVYAKLERMFGGRRTLFDVSRIAVMVVLFFAVSTVVVVESTPLARETSKLFILVILLGTVLFLFLFSKRRVVLLQLAACVSLGFLIGNAPQWIPWMFYGTVPYPGARFGHPSFSTLGPLFDVILPTLWGAVHPVSVWVKAKYSLSKILGLGAVNVIAIMGILMFMYRERSMLFSLITARPLPSNKIPASIIFFLFLFPLVALYYKGVGGVSSIRFVVSVWPACMVLLAIGFDRLFQHSRKVGVCVLLFFVVNVGLSTWTMARHTWGARFSRFPPEAVHTLEEQLITNNVEGGYATYWIGYTLNFLLEERIVFSQLQRDRYPPYNEKVSAMERFAVITFVKRHSIPKESRDSEDLITNLIADNPVVREPLLESIRSSVFQNRFSIANHWDVWIFQRQ